MDNNNNETVNECPICLDFIDSSNIKNTNYKCCNYKIHHKCFMNIVINTGKCPICRSIFELPTIYFINFDKSIFNIKNSIDNSNLYLINFNTNLNNKSLLELDYILNSLNCTKPIIIVNDHNNSNNFKYKYIFEISKNNINSLTKLEIFDLNPVNKYYSNIKEYINFLDEVLSNNTQIKTTLLAKIKQYFQKCFIFKK